MPRDDVVLHISAPGVPRAAILDAQERLVRELNEAGPIAEVVTRGERAGSKGVLEVLGQVGIAVLSAGALKYIAQVITEFVKRNDRYEICVGDVKITRDHASEQEIERINKILLQVMERRRRDKKAK